PDDDVWRVGTGSREGRDEQDGLPRAPAGVGELVEIRVIGIDEPVGLIGLRRDLAGRRDLGVARRAANLHAHVASSPEGPWASNSSNCASSRIVRPSSRALVSFDPAPGPTTTKSVFFDTLPAALPPRARIASFAPSRVNP